MYHENESSVNSAMTKYELPYAPSVSYGSEFALSNLWVFIMTFNLQLWPERQISI